MLKAYYVYIAYCTPFVSEEEGGNPFNMHFS